MITTELHTHTTTHNNTTIMGFGGNAWVYKQSGAEQIKDAKHTTENARIKLEQDRLAPLHAERNRLEHNRIMKSRNSSLETMITREDVKALKMVQELWFQKMIKVLGHANGPVQQEEVRLFLSHYSTAREDGAEGTDLIKLPSYTTEALLSKGLARTQARIIQNKITASWKSKTTKKYLSVTAEQRRDFRIQTMATRKEEVESAIAMGWRPEHVALLNRLWRYNDSIVRSIPEWEQEELLAEFVDAFWFSENYEEDMKRFHSYIPEVDFLSPETIAKLEERHYYIPEVDCLFERNAT